MKKRYDDLIKFIIRNAKPIVLGKRKYWVGLNAIKSCQSNGLKFLQFEIEDILAKVK